MEEQKCMIGPEHLKLVFALIGEKVTIEEEHRKVKRCIMDVLNAPKGLVSIDVNDVRDLFQEGGVIHAFDVSVDALMANRMNLMMWEYGGGRLGCVGIPWSWSRVPLHHPL